MASRGVKAHLEPPEGVDDAVTFPSMPPDAPSVGSTAPGGPMPRTLTLPSLTSLRFFAAALVVLVHAGSFFPSLRGITEHGTVGVSFFFLLSGFILTWSASST